MKMVLFAQGKQMIDFNCVLGPSEESPPQTDQVNNLPPRLKQLKIVQNW